MLIQPSLSGDPEQSSPERHPHFATRAVGMFRDLFPIAEPAEPTGPRGRSVVIQVVAVAIGTIALLLRVPGIPAWHTMYAEDYWLFFPQALEHPWHLLTPDGGYIEFVPRLIAQLATYLPLTAAAAAFAVIGALTACGCALFIFHASAGFIDSPWLRALLASALVLLPVTPLEIIDSGVGSPWYLLIALFWAMLWRPRSRTGMVIAALIGFLTVASTILAVVLVPLLLARVIALRGVREHAVTAGWAAGLLLQLPFVLQGLGAPGSRAGRLAPFDQAVAFYGHDVVLPALGWHLSWWLKSSVGPDYGMLIIGAPLAITFIWAMVTQGRTAGVFVLTALLIGFLEIVVAGTLTWWVPSDPVLKSFEPGSRYTDLPIFLIDAALICSLDAFFRRTPIRLRAVTAVTALVAILAVGWVTDFRYPGGRTAGGGRSVAAWPQISARWLRACENHPTGVIEGPTYAGKIAWLPCERLHG